MKTTKILSLAAILGTMFFLPNDVSASQTSEATNFSSYLPINLEVGNSNLFQEDVHDRLFSELFNLSYSLADREQWSGNTSLLERNRLKSIHNGHAVGDNNAEPTVSVPQTILAEPGPTSILVSSTFTNDSNRDHNFQFQGFEHETEIVATTRGGNLGINANATAELHLPLTTMGETSINVPFDYSSSRATVTRGTHTWTIPTQDIVIPAGRTYRMEIQEGHNSAFGNVNLNFRVMGVVPYKALEFSQRFGLPLGMAMKRHDTFAQTWPSEMFSPETRDQWTIVDQWQADRKFGNGSYDVQYVGGLRLVVRDVTGDTRGEGTIVESRTITNSDLK